VSGWICGQSQPDMQLWELGRIKQWVHTGELSFGIFKHWVWAGGVVQCGRAWGDYGVILSQWVCGESEQDMQLWKLGRVK
jgi:hypothetical protein